MAACTAPSITNMTTGAGPPLLCSKCRGAANQVPNGYPASDPTLPANSGDSSDGETLLRHAVEHSLRAFLEPSAVFLAERLYAHAPSPASANLLATAYLRQGSLSQAADVLRAYPCPENCYLAAVCHARIDTPSSLREAEALLRPSSPFSSSSVLFPSDTNAIPCTPSPSNPISRPNNGTPASVGNPSNASVWPSAPSSSDLASATPGGAAGLYLLAIIYQRTGRRDEAITLYRQAVSVNPTLWSAFEALASFGVVARSDTTIPNISDSHALAMLHSQPHFQPGLVANSSKADACHPSNMPLSTPSSSTVMNAIQPQLTQSFSTPLPSHTSLPPPKFSLSRRSDHNNRATTRQSSTSAATASLAAAAALTVPVGEDPLFVTPPVGMFARVVPGVGGLGGMAFDRAISLGEGAHLATPFSQSGTPNVSASVANVATTIQHQQQQQQYTYRSNHNHGHVHHHSYHHTPRRLPRRSGSPSSLVGLRAGRRTRFLPDDHSASARGAPGGESFATPSLGRALFPSSPSHATPTISSAPPSPLSAPATANIKQNLSYPLTGGETGAVAGAGVRANADTALQSGLQPNGSSTRPPTPKDLQNSLDAIALIQAVGQICADLGRFRSDRALEASNRLSTRQRNTGFVLSLRGRAYLEKGDYAAAEGEFMKALQLEPSRTEGVADYYSTVLWHLKKEKELASLAIRAHHVSPVSAAAWCAAGNCFSLQHDGDAAIRYFQRAIALSSRCANAYAHTLCGHEFLAKENFDAALTCYREALQIDERHYNAMYGIGQVFLKQEKYSLAQQHFRSAVAINPRNSILHYHFGVSLAAGVSLHAEELEDGSGAMGNELGSRQTLIRALGELETAANLDLQNPVPRFERAKIWVGMGQLPEARAQLEELRDSLPKEAEVHFELSRVCHRMGDRKSALQALSVAIDIEPKERKYKKAIESLSNELETAKAVW